MGESQRGRELHREFVGMLFALAIAEVAVQAGGVVNSRLPLNQTIPTYSHLFLASAVIATSWVGWGWSKHSLSDVRNVFTLDFVELLLDLWLVAVYFFIVKGVELPVAGEGSITPSMSNEVSWVMVVYLTYFVWDVWTKRLKKDDVGRFVLFQRGWASALCAALSVVAFNLLPMQTTDAARVVLADVSLLAMVFLFRAMKIRNLSDLSTSNWFGIGILALLWGVSVEGSAQMTRVGSLLGMLFEKLIT